MFYKWLLSAALVALATNGAWADKNEGNGDDMRINERAASIPFADYRGRIRDWRDQGRSAILIQTDTGNWYRAEFMSPCYNLPFAETIGFVLDGTHRIDKFSSIVVRGAGGMVEECWFRSFNEVPAPG